MGHFGFRRRIISKHIISRFSSCLRTNSRVSCTEAAAALKWPWTEEGKRGFRHLQIGTDQVTLELMREGKYDQILKRMENVLDLSKERRFCGKDGIWVGVE